MHAAQSVLRHLNREKYHLLPVGITEEGDWILFGGHDGELPDEKWQENPMNARAAISPIRGQGLLRFEADCVVREHIDVVFPLLYGQKGHSGAVQGLLQLADIPCVGSGIGATAICADRERLKQALTYGNIPQSRWLTVRQGETAHHMEQVLARLEKELDYPMSVYPACGGDNRKTENREQLREAMQEFAARDEKILVEPFTDGRKIQVAVMGNSNPVVSLCGEVTGEPTDRTGVDIPARIREETEEEVREWAVKVYSAIGCRGLALLEFLVGRDDGRILFHNITTMPDFAGMSMYQKLFAASGIPYGQLLDELLELAMEDRK
jgi:D-alanine-D-alanine ligase